MPIRDQLKGLQAHLASQIIGQPLLVQRLLIGLLADGHLLVEGAPGLAKTRAVKALAQGLEADFHRIQFTPDLLPADVTGSDVYRPEEGSFHFNKGPIFHHILLADEINRAPAKVQSALLEAMAERQVSVGAASYALPRLFLVMATQNPIEQEGTYPLPEAQLDRFMLHVQIGYPSREASHQILALAREEAQADKATAEKQPDTLSQETIFQARKEVLQLHMAENVERYIIELIEATRNPGAYGKDIKNWVDWGASPRGAIAIERCARATAWLAARDYVTPDDVQAVAGDALRHRILLNFSAEADGVTPQQCINTLLERVPTP